MFERFYNPDHSDSHGGVACTEYMTSKGPTDDHWVFNIQIGQWALIETIGPRPPPRAHHTATAVGSDLLVLGGYGKIQDAMHYGTYCVLGRGC